MHDATRAFENFSPKIAMLYEMAGMEHPSDATHPNRKRERLRMALSLMVDHGLLLDWSSAFLSADEDFCSDPFVNKRVNLHLPSSLLRYLPRKAISREEQLGLLSV